MRIQDCWARPIVSRAGAYIDVLERWESREGLGDGRPLLHLANGVEPRRCLNLGSYNYLGYAEFGSEDKNVVSGVASGVSESLDSWGVNTGGSEGLGGRCKEHVELERLVAWFLKKESAVVMGMGFATNSQIIPSLVGKGDLVVSDELNHASIVVGIRSSGAKVRIFSHNNMKGLEKVLREAIVEGQDGNGKGWNRIWIVVEGMYSMEGASCKVRELVQIKKKYGAYLYLDEAHSIGALGKSGRGVCEHHGVDTRDVDIMMGTFTKSFGAVGGYVASTKGVIARIRRTAPGLLYAASMSVPCVLHISHVLRQIAGIDGSDIGQKRINQLRENSIYFRQRLINAGLQLYGDWDSPIVPIMIYQPSRIAAFSRMCYQRGVAVVVAGFPATPLLLGRARVCLSAAHTREDLDFAIRVIVEVATIVQIKYNQTWMETLLPKNLLEEAGCIQQQVKTLLFGNDDSQYNEAERC